MSSFTDDLTYKPTGKWYKGNRIYSIEKEFSYAFGDLNNPIHIFTVPVGYETDLASIPWPFKLVFKPDGKWAKAAVIHDFIYSDYPEISKIVADAVFLEAMIVLKINPLLAHLFFAAVRLNNAFQGR